MRLQNGESQVWWRDAELHFKLGEFEGWHAGEIQAQAEQGSLAHKWELKLGKSREGRALVKASS